MVDSLSDLSAYYLIENQGKQSLVNVTNEFIISSDIS